MKEMETMALEIWGEWIELHQLLKVTGIAGSGGEAKGMVSGGVVEVDGVRELRKAAKVRVGQVVVAVMPVVATATAACTAATRRRRRL